MGFCMAVSVTAIPPLPVCGRWAWRSAMRRSRGAENALRDITPQTDWVCDADSIYYNTWQERDDPICWKVGTTMWSIWRIISIRMPMLASFASIRRPILSRNGLRHFLSLQQGANRRLYWLAGSGYGSHAALDGSGTESAYSDYGPSAGRTWSDAVSSETSHRLRGLFPEAATL